MQAIPLHHRLFIFNNTTMKLHLSLPLSILAAALLVVGCEKQPTAPGAMSLPLNPPSGGSTSYSSSPKIIIVGDSEIKSHGVTADYPTLAVMDSTGANYRTVLISSDYTKGYSCPRWSPSGGHISYMASYGTITVHGTNWGGFNNIEIGTISVSSSGPSLGSISTLMTPFFGSDTNSYSAVAWTSQSDGNIAVAGNKFVDSNIQSSSQPCKIWIVSSSGGTPSLLYTGNPHETIQSLSWSPDGTRIVTTVKMGATSSTNQMRIINSSTGAVTDTLGFWGVSNNFGYARWSNSGANQIAFTIGTSSGPYLYTYDYGTATLSSAITAGDMCCWNPSDTKFLYYRPTSLSSSGSFTYTIASGTMTNLNPPHGKTAYFNADWRRD